MRRSLHVTRWALARAFGVHPGTISNAWLHEGLRAALVSPGGPGKPALYDGHQAVEWFNARKARGPSERKTIDDLRAIVEDAITENGQARSRNQPGS
jgi:hypothetical protein